MDKAKLDELARLQEDARKAPLAVTRDLDDGCALIDDRGVCIATTMWLTDARWLAAIHNSFPAILEYVRELERERDERITMAARAQEALRYLMNGLPADDAVWAAYGNADSARAWLSARDARLKREGAAEWLENAARDGGYYERSSEGMLEEAKQLREGKV